MEFQNRFKPDNNGPTGKKRKEDEEEQVLEMENKKADKPKKMTRAGQQGNERTPTGSENINDTNIATGKRREAQRREERR